MPAEEDLRDVGVFRTPRAVRGALVVGPGLAVHHVGAQHHTDVARAAMVIAVDDALAQHLRNALALYVVIVYHIQKLRVLTQQSHGLLLHGGIVQTALLDEVGVQVDAHVHDGLDVFAVGAKLGFQTFLQHPVGGGTVPAIGGYLVATAEVGVVDGAMVGREKQ